jgi:hypothetical protein
VNTYPITKGANETELSNIQDTLHNNEYNKDLSTRHPNQCKQKQNTDLQH